MWQWQKCYVCVLYLYWGHKNKRDFNGLRRVESEFLEPQRKATCLHPSSYLHPHSFGQNHSSLVTNEDLTYLQRVRLAFVKYFLWELTKKKKKSAAVSEAFSRASTVAAMCCCAA